MRRMMWSAPNGALTPVAGTNGILGRLEPLSEFVDERIGAPFAEVVDGQIAMTEGGLYYVRGYIPAVVEIDGADPARAAVLQTLLTIENPGPGGGDNS